MYRILASEILAHIHTIGRGQGSPESSSVDFWLVNKQKKKKTKRGAYTT